MGAHALPVLTSLLIRDTAEVFESHEIDADAVAEQARSILEDITIAAWKVGFWVAPMASAPWRRFCPTTHVPRWCRIFNLSWLEDEAQMSYLDAFKEIRYPPHFANICWSETTNADRFSLPEWDSERAPSARELAIDAASEAGVEYVLVTSIPCPTNS